VIGIDLSWAEKTDRMWKSGAAISAASPAAYEVKPQRVAEKEDKSTTSL
jgi:hypothetical protein